MCVYVWWYCKIILRLIDIVLVIYMKNKGCMDCMDWCLMIDFLVVLFMLFFSNWYFWGNFNFGIFIFLIEFYRKMLVNSKMVFLGGLIVYCMMVVIRYMIFKC